MAIKRHVTRIVGTVGIALGLSACATVAGTESLLSQAGFRQVPADTPQKLAHLRTLPEHRLISRDHQGKKYYVYADPDNCKCLYMGTPAQYQTYRNLVKEKRAEQGEAVEE